VRIGDYSAGKDGYIDKQGMVVIEPASTPRFLFSGGAGRRAHRRPNTASSTRRQDRDSAALRFRRHVSAMGWRDPPPRREDGK